MQGEVRVSLRILEKLSLLVYCPQFEARSAEAFFHTLNFPHTYTRAGNPGVHIQDFSLLSLTTLLDLQIGRFYL